MVGYYQADSHGFRLFESPNHPSWRRPQSAALGAVLAQWSIAGGEAPLVSVPTGVGKTAIALAAPFVAGASRVLVVVPTKELRRQTVEQFRTQAVLLRIGALREADFEAPIVAEITGRDDDWTRLEAFDVVVGIPASVSPSHFESAPPPSDLFDLVIVDEAHHAPASTWHAILDHFDGRALLLTATPHRRDRKRIPGKLVYYFPLRQALSEGLYQPVEPRVLELPAGATKATSDALVAAEVASLLGLPEHATSQAIIRAGTKLRASALAEIYAALGYPFPVLHSGLGAATQRAVIDGLRDGTHRGVVMVGMLVEGFDLPSCERSSNPTARDRRKRQRVG